jgi:two-component system, OmpR family, sensor kinase
VRLHAILAEETDRDLLMIGDPELLRTLVDNLLRNAIRFSPQGSRIDVVVRTDGPDNICICVQDKGPGIPQPLIDRIFDRFAQGRGEEKLGRGSGLGLEIAQGIAELHGGRISASNLDEGGCEFCATLPLATSAAPDTPTCEEAKSQEATSDEAASPVR